MITAIMTSFLTLILTQIQENPWCQNFGWKFWLLGIAFHKGGEAPLLDWTCSRLPSHGIESDSAERCFL